MKPCRAGWQRGEKGAAGGGSGAASLGRWSGAPAAPLAPRNSSRRHRRGEPAQGPASNLWLRGKHGSRSGSGAAQEDGAGVRSCPSIFRSRIFRSRLAPLPVRAPWHGGGRGRNGNSAVLMAHGMAQLLPHRMAQLLAQLLALSMAHRMAQPGHSGDVAPFPWGHGDTYVRRVSWHRGHVEAAPGSQPRHRAACGPDWNKLGDPG